MGNGTDRAALVKPSRNGRHTAAPPAEVDHRAAAIIVVRLLYGRHVEPESRKSLFGGWSRFASYLDDSEGIGNKTKWEHIWNSLKYTKKNKPSEAETVDAMVAALEAVRKEYGDKGPGDEGDDVEESQQVVDRWPEVPYPAFHGIAGEIVAAIDPHTEADPIATLTQFIVAFANLIGRSAHYRVGATRHYLNLFCVMVGGTATGRKGTSWDIARWALATFDDTWDYSCIQSGLVSGEGLIHHVRDPTTKAAKSGTKVVDAGVSDKRLLIVETEMSRALKAINRDSNTLSDVIRQAWDSGHLRTLGKNSPARATDAHVSLICHTTQADIARHLTDTDTGNGFANRFLWLAVRRSKLLPEGGDISAIDFAPVSRQLKPIIDHARNCGEMIRTPAAKEKWAEVYPRLSQGRPGLAGAVLSRAEPQVMRLACVYALLDGRAAVDVGHLDAALALWAYSEASVRMVFGDSLGEPAADKLLDALRAAPDGLTRTQIFIEVFGKNKPSPQIVQLLSNLLTQRLIHRRTERAGRGRPTERWFDGPGYGEG